jgi:hypothetical protein
VVDLAVDIAGLRRGQVGDGGGDLVRVAGPSGRDPVQPFLAALLAEAAAEELGVLDEAGRDRVGGDPEQAQVEGQGLGEPDDPGLGGGIGAAAPGEGGDRAQVDDPSAGASQVGEGGPAQSPPPHARPSARL